LHDPVVAPAQNAAPQPTHRNRHEHCSRSGSCIVPGGGRMDVLYVGLTVLFFAVSLALVELFDRL
jgi:hypothetical protein